MKSLRGFSSLIGLLLVAIMIAIGYSAYAFHQQTSSPSSENTYPSIHSSWTYTYAPLGMRMTLDEEWEQASIASLILPLDITGERFAFQKKGTSCVLVYVTATESALENYVEITDTLAAAGNITDRNLLKRIYNQNLGTVLSIESYGYRTQLAAFEEQHTSDNTVIERFSDANVIFISSLPEFKESSKQNPMFVLYDNASEGPFDGYCLSDMVKIVAAVGRM